VPAIALALRAKAIIIENVPSVLRDRGRVVEKARAVLGGDYNVMDVVLEADRLGVAQQRRRHFLVATLGTAPSLSSLYQALGWPRITVGDAIGDLSSVRTNDPFQSPAALSIENKTRIEHLFDNDLYDLPNEVRPDCHKDGHTYPSVYGRLHRDRPAQTLTGGFLSPGRGRYVHPTERRGLTPQEGARLQGFPDTFAFARADGDSLTRKDYAKLIGDAVPPPLGYALGLTCIASL
jgi:DNA (cytosine-5)-methyltransferase 1